MRMYLNGSKLKSLVEVLQKSTEGVGAKVQGELVLGQRSVQ